MVGGVGPTRLAELVIRYEEVYCTVLIKAGEFQDPMESWVELFNRVAAWNLKEGNFFLLYPRTFCNYLPLEGSPTGRSTCWTPLSIQHPDTVETVY